MPLMPLVPAQLPWGQPQLAFFSRPVLSRRASEPYCEAQLPQTNVLFYSGPIPHFDYSNVTSSMYQTANLFNPSAGNVYMMSSPTNGPQNFPQGPTVIKIVPQQPPKKSTGAVKQLENAQDPSSSKPASTAASRFMSQIRDRINAGCRRRDDEELRKVFDSFAEPSASQSGSKHMPKKHVHSSLKKLNVHIREDEVETFFDSANLNDDAILDFDEFKQAVGWSTRLLEWTKSLPLAEILADALPKSTANEPLRDISQLTYEEMDLISEAFYEEFKNVLKQRILKLKEAFKALDSKQASEHQRVSKFEVVRMSCGTIEDFHHGLQKRIGHCHLDFEKSMEAEHCLKAGNETPFTTSNYGIVSWPRKEWGIVVRRDPCQELDLKGERQIPDIDALLGLELAKRANLTREEVIAIVLYTGPMFQVYNLVLRRYPEAEFEIFKKGKNLFSTTIFVLVSAVQKISRAMKLPQGLRLYRGLGGTKDLPESFFKRDGQGCKGFADWGFMSTTANKDVAIKYSGVGEDKPLPIVLEISFGAVDRGACIRDFSQYPAEVEYLYVPCSFLEQDGNEYVESTKDGIVKVFPVKVNANLKTFTVEYLLSQKRTMHLTAFNYAVDDIDAQLHAVARDGDAETRLTNDKTRDGNHSVEGLLSRIVAQCREVYSRHESVGSKEYTNDGIFRNLVLEMMDVRLMATSKLDEWLENVKGSFTRFRLNAPLRTAHRRWISYLQRQLLDATGTERVEASIRLCKVKGLIVKSVDEQNELGETRLMAAAAEGKSISDVRLLVDAGANVKQARNDGVHPMWLAAQFGHIYVIEELHELKADVNQCANDGASPLYIASQSGNLECIRTLMKLKADIHLADKKGLTPLHQAAMNEHDKCIEELIRHGAKVESADIDGRTAFDLLPANAQGKCREMLTLKDTAKSASSQKSTSNAGQHSRAKKLIISTGDISDVDGFLALAEYGKTGADVLFVMNYPAYIGVSPTEVDNKFAESNPGLGYKYSAKEMLQLVSDPPAQYTDILNSYAGLTENEVMKGAMTDVAFWLATKVWQEAPANRGKLYFCIGGINQVNPFSERAIKNELVVLSKLNPAVSSKLSPKEGTVYDDGGLECKFEWSKYSDIFMDFNGSMAFWDESWTARLTDAEIRDKIKGAFVMGGVWAEMTPVTMPSIPNVLNRFSSATMNQLYHPQRAADFFAFLEQAKIPIFVVTNNAVGDFSTPHNIDDGLTKFLAANELNGEFLRTLAFAHYNSSYTPPRKPYDFYTALALKSWINSQHKEGEIPSRRKQLFYSNVYGITFVSVSDSWEATRAKYISVVDTSVSETDDEKSKNKKEYFRKEIALMKGIEHLASVPVFDLRFEMDKSTFELRLVDSD